MIKSKMLVALPALAVLAVAVPQTAEARTKSIVKWGAIGIGAAALGNHLNQQNQQRYYYQQPYYGNYYYQQPSYGYYQQPSYYSSGYYSNGYYYR